MTVGLQIPTADLRQLRGQFVRLQSAGLRREVNQRMGIAALGEVGRGFEQSVDPYGRQWAPLTSRDGQPLRDTGSLFNSFTPKWTPSDFSLATNRKGAATHQYGATITAKGNFLKFRIGGARPRTSGQFVQKKSVTIPQRQMVPEGELSPGWLAVLFAEGQAAVNDIFGL